MTEIDTNIINGLPLTFTGQPGFLRNQGSDFMCDLFDECGFEPRVMSHKQIAERLSPKYGSLVTRTYKVRAAVAYLLAEGQKTGEPQIFKFAGHIAFRPNPV